MREAKAPLKVTVVADVEQVNELMLTESTVIDWHPAEAILVYYEGKVTVSVSLALTYMYLAVLLR